MDNLLLISIFLPLLMIGGIAGLSKIADDLSAKGMTEEEVVGEICRRLTFWK